MFFKDKMYWAVLYSEMHVWYGGGGELGALTWSFSVVFFQDKAKHSLLAGRPCPFLPLVMSPVATGKCGSLNSPSWLLWCRAGATSEVSFLSEHTVPCSK